MRFSSFPQGSWLLGATFALWASAEGCSLNPHPMPPDMNNGPALRNPGDAGAGMLGPGAGGSGSGGGALAGTSSGASSGSNPGGGSSSGESGNGGTADASASDAARDATAGDAAVRDAALADGAALLDAPSWDAPGLWDGGPPGTDAEIAAHDSDLPANADASDDARSGDSALQDGALDVTSEEGE